MSGELHITGRKHNGVILFDEQDRALVESRPWHIWRGYALSSVNSKKKTSLHREILGFPDGMVDHINGNGLDNRRCNLRVVTRAQNTMNTPKRKNTSSKHKGVCFHKRTGTWHAYARIGGVRVHLKQCRTEEEAAAVAAPHYRTEYHNR